MIVAYVSGHGFGHATRVAEVLRVLREIEPGVELGVVSSAPEALFREAVSGALSYRCLECDVGLVQQNALEIDEAATAHKCQAFDAALPGAVESEADWLRRSGARVVLGDIPPLAFAAAERAELPALGLANFSWDWIYRCLSVRHPSLLVAADRAAAAYAKATLLLELPFAGDLGVFPKRQPIPLVARRPNLARDLARRRLGLDGDSTAVLLSFGGLGLNGLDGGQLSPLEQYRFLTTGHSAARGGNLRTLAHRELAELGFGYQDLVAAVDVVVTKPGYGIVSDAIGARTRMVYTERGDFPEYPILVEGLSRHLPCAYVSNGDLRAGRLADPLRKAMEMAFPEPPDLGGAEVAARRLLDHLS